MSRESSDRAMVAVCDILGYSNLIKETPHSEVVSYHIENMQTALRSSIPNFPNQPTDVTSEQIFIEGLVGFATFSDTVLLYSLQDDRRGYRAVIEASTRLLARHILWPTLRFRIGIAYGEFHADPNRNIFVGKALVEAHELERRQDWCGAALTDNAYAQILDSSTDREWLVPYDVPIRGGSKESHMVINWCYATHRSLPERDWIERNYNIGATEEEKIKIENKLSNTEQFHAVTCQRCKY